DGTIEEHNFLGCLYGAKTVVVVCLNVDKDNMEVNADDDLVDWSKGCRPLGKAIYKWERDKEEVGSGTRKFIFQTEALQASGRISDRRFPKGVETYCWTNLDELKEIEELGGRICEKSFFDSFVFWDCFSKINELSHVQIPVMLMPDDFKAYSKIKVDNHLFNKENMPSHFKFKEYCPMVFRNLRERFGIDDQDFQLFTGDHFDKAEEGP
ncbi:hypothetical protein STEG23_011372, partial [Scotinomys teguina]